MAAVKARQPQLPVLFYSGFDEASYAPTVLRRGAGGYVSKESHPRELLDAIRLVAQGRRYITPRVAELLADELMRGANVPAHDQLSERELQVFIHLAQGSTVGELARELCLSIKTVSTYRSRVLVKLGLGSNSELTYYALRHGLIQ
jgi:DNA-binding NarL/FixJ family response regulator